MRQQLFRLVCDDCGLVMMFEIVNSNPLTVTTDVPAMIERHGWQSVPKEGGGMFDLYDRCAACKR